MEVSSNTFQISISGHVILRPEAEEYPGSCHNNITMINSAHSKYLIITLLHTLLIRGFLF